MSRKENTYFVKIVRDFEGEVKAENEDEALDIVRDDEDFYTGEADWEVTLVVEGEPQCESCWEFIEDEDKKYCSRCEKELEKEDEDEIEER